MRKSPGSPNVLPMSLPGFDGEENCIPLLARTYARLMQHLKNLEKNWLGPLRKAYCSSPNLLLRREACEFANELLACTRASKNPTLVWLEASSGSSSASYADTSTVSDAYSKMFPIFIPCR